MNWYGMWFNLRGKPEYVALVNHEGKSFMVSRQMLIEQPKNGEVQMTS